MHENNNLANKANIVRQQQINIQLSIDQIEQVSDYKFSAPALQYQTGITVKIYSHHPHNCLIHKNKFITQKH